MGAKSDHFSLNHLTIHHTLQVQELQKFRRCQLFWINDERTFTQFSESYRESLPPCLQQDQAHSANMLNIVQLTLTTCYMLAWLWLLGLLYALPFPHAMYSTSERFPVDSVLFFPVSIHIHTITFNTLLRHSLRIV